MKTLSIIFIIIAAIEIIIAAIKWISTGKSEFLNIGGWTCALIWCINATF